MLEIDTLKLNSRINEHAQMHVRATLSGGQEEYDAICKLDDNTPITLIERSSKKSTDLFTGFAKQLSVRFTHELLRLDVTVVSTTCKLDESTETKRAFQNPDTTIGELIEAGVGDEICLAGRFTSEAIGTFAVQYKETDWAFLKRMASRVKTGLVADFLSTEPQLNFAEELSDSFEVDERNLLSIQKSVANGKSSLSYFYLIEKGYETGNAKKHDYKIGAKFDGGRVCKSVETRVEEGMIRYIVELTNSLEYPMLYNEKLSGVSFKGKVLENDEDGYKLAQVKIHLTEFEEEEPNPAKAFDYATLYATSDQAGWHFMPEIGDTVMLYFPNEQENNAYCTASVRVEKLANADITHGDKIIATPGNKMIQINEDSILIKSNESTSIKMSGEGLSIATDKPLKITTDDDLTLEATNSVIIQSSSTIDLTANGSAIKMSSGIELEGDNVNIG